MAPGFLTLHHPGTSVSVTLVADSSGDVAQLNDLVEIVGENSSHTEVSLVENDGAGVAALETLPDEYDETTDYSAGEVIGEATVLLRHPIDWLVPTDGDWVPSTTETESPAAGDLTVSESGGSVRGYDTAGGDTGDMVLGPVWTTLNRGAQTDGKIAVARQR